MHNGMSQQTTLQMSHSPNKSQYYDISRNGNRYGPANGEREQQHRWVAQSFELMSREFILENF